MTESNTLPLISVIIPSFNREDFIAETLQSVLGQTYSKWECIVVDDASTDNTEKVVSAFAKADSRISFYKRPDHKPKGANACRNFGFEMSKGVYVNWLDSDDILSPHHFQLHIAEHHSKSINASVSVVETFQDKISNPKGLWANSFPKNDIVDAMIQGEVSWQTASVLWKRASLPKSPFDERLQSSQEWTFHLQQVLAGIKYTVFDAVTVFVRRHEQRTGKDFSAKKYRSMFYSRYMILKQLKRDNLLHKPREYGLLKRMFQASKGASRAKYFKTALWQWRKLFSLLSVLRYQTKTIRVLLLGIPLYLILGKGEQFFKI